MLPTTAAKDDCQGKKFLNLEKVGWSKRVAAKKVWGRQVQDLA
jgi:hypothetical protein